MSAQHIMKRKQAKALLLAMESKTMGEIAQFLTPGATEETRTAMVRSVAALEVHLRQLMTNQTPPPNEKESRCQCTLEMEL